MNAFRFPLEKVLGWRRSQLEIEQARYRRCAAEVAALDQARAGLQASAARAESEVRAWPSLAGAELTALAQFLRSIRSRERQIAARRAESVKAAEAQMKILLDAQRRCRLLERLKDLRFAEWTAAANRELDQIASESYLARWMRERDRGVRPV